MVPLFWKSYRELRWLALAALLVVFIPSIIEGMLNRRYDRAGEFRTDLPSGLIASLGWFLAILVAVAQTSGDLREPLFTFWRSRPIGAGRYLGVKYVSGLMVLAGITAAGMVFELWTQSRLDSYQTHPWLVLGTGEAGLFWSQFFTHLLVYSSAFCLGCLLRQGVTTTLFSFAAALLIYFGPLLIPGLRALDTFQWFQDRPLEVLLGAYPPYAVQMKAFLLGVGSLGLYIRYSYIFFSLAMIAGSLILFGMGVFVVHRGATWNAEQRGVCWTFGLVALLLFWGASTHLGSNLEAKRVETPDEEGLSWRVNGIHMTDGRGYVAYRPMGLEGAPQKVAAFDPDKDNPVSNRSHDFYSPLPQSVAYYETGSAPMAWNPLKDSIVYSFLEEGEESDAGPRQKKYTRTRLELATFDLAREPGAERVNRIELGSYFDINMSGRGTWYPGIDVHFRPALPGIYSTERRLYIHTPEQTSLLTVFDLADPRKPVFIETRACPVVEIEPSFVENGAAPEYRLSLPDLPGATPRQCLEALIAFQLPRSMAALDGDLYVRVDIRDAGEIRLFRVLRFEGEEEGEGGGQNAPPAAILELAGVRKVSPLIRLMENDVQEISLRDNRLALLVSGISRGVLVYDLSNPRRIARVGHFVPGKDRLSAIALLPGDRLVAAGYKLHFLDLPRRDR